MKVLMEYRDFISNRQEGRVLREISVNDFLSNKALFREYVEKLARGIDDPVAKSDFLKVAFSQYTLLQEQGLGSIASDAELAKAWVVEYFPILASLYEEPTVYRVLTVLNTNNPQIDVPRRKVVANVIDYTGKSVTVELPVHKAVKPNKFKTNNLVEGTNDLKTILGITDSEVRLNKTYFAITKLVVKDTPSSGSPVTKELTVMITPDINGMLKGEAKFNAEGDGKVVTVKLFGSVNFDECKVDISVNIDTDSSDDIKFENASAEGRLIFSKSNKGKVFVAIKVENVQQKFIDEDNSFVFRLEPEQVQDLKDIYNIDALTTLIEVIKQQIVLNKNEDVTDLLKQNIPEMMKYGNYAEIDFNTAIPTSVTPSNVHDIYTFIVPKILNVARNIKRHSFATPQYILASGKAYTLLESLKQYITLKVDSSTSKFGPVADSIEYTKFNIIESFHEDEDYIYIVYKGENPAFASLVDVVYKPLYMVKSSDQGSDYHYIKTRTFVMMVDPKKVGVIKLSNVYS